MLNDSERNAQYLRNEFNRRTANLSPESKAMLAEMHVTDALAFLGKWESHLQTSQKPDDQAITLTPEQQALAQRMGLSEKDVLASLEEQRRRQQR